jgi:hypothetical protein
MDLRHRIGNGCGFGLGDLGRLGALAVAVFVLAALVFVGLYGRLVVAGSFSTAFDALQGEDDLFVGAMAWP